MLEIASGGKQYSFPTTLTNEERKFVHKCALKLGLKSKSCGERNEDRYVTVFIPKNDDDGEQIDQIELKAPSVDHLTSYLANDELKFPSKPPRESIREKKSRLDRELQFTPTNPTESNRLLKDRKLWQTKNKYAQLQARLPAASYRDRIITALAEHPIIIISGETGCGKSTQVPQFVFDSWIDANRGGDCNIICTQPRRLSAMALADRVAEERYNYYYEFYDTVRCIYYYSSYYD